MNHGPQPGWSATPTGPAGPVGGPVPPPTQYMQSGSGLPGYGQPTHGQAPPQTPGSWTGPVPQQGVPYQQGLPIPQQQGYGLQSGGWVQDPSSQPLAPPSPPPAAEPQKGGGWGRKALAGALVLAVAGGAAVGYDSFFGPTADASVALEGTNTAGSAPFTAPVGQDVTGVVAPEGASGTQVGNTGGLYAQDPAELACDRDALVGGIQADAGKSAAWASALGLSGAEVIPAYAQSLTPVTLRADTSVTQYGYRGGAFQSYPSILQAGTAVLVNSFGEPTVKCFNGNPLGAATASNSAGLVGGVTGGLVGGPSYRGTAWSGFSGGRTVSVTPTAAPQRSLPVLDPRTNTQAPVPVTTGPNGTPNPAPKTDSNGALTLTGPYTHDGGMLLADGSVRRPDGTVVAPAPIPAGATTLPGGGYQLPDGSVVNLNGTPRLPVKLSNTRMLGLDGVVRAINPDGSIGDPVRTTTGTNFTFNYDGSVLSYSPTTENPDILNVGVRNPDGSVRSTRQVNRSDFNADGSTNGPNGTIINPDGTPRQPVTLSNGSTQYPDGTIYDPNTRLVGGTKVTGPNVRSQAEQQRTAAVQGGAPAGGSAPGSGSASTSGSTSGSGSGSASGSGSGSASGSGSGPASGSGSGSTSGSGSGSASGSGSGSGSASGSGSGPASGSGSGSGSR